MKRHGRVSVTWNAVLHLLFVWARRKFLCYSPQQNVMWRHKTAARVVPPSLPTTNWKKTLTTSKALLKTFNFTLCVVSQLCLLFQILFETFYLPGSSTPNPHFILMKCEAAFCFKFISDPNDFLERDDSYLRPCCLRALEGQEMGWNLLSPQSNITQGRKKRKNLTEKQRRANKKYHFIFPPHASPVVFYQRTTASGIPPYSLKTQSTIMSLNRADFVSFVVMEKKKFPLFVTSPLQWNIGFKGRLYMAHSVRSAEYYSNVTI